MHMRAQLSVRGLRFAAGSLSSRSLSSLAELLNNGHPYNNVPESVKSRVGMQLHRREKHPLNTIKTVIHEYFSAPSSSPPFKLFDDLSPIVSSKQNFDELLTPADHVSRQPADTFYLTPDTLLRTHTSAHQTQLLRARERAFLVAGDVYRRDSVDASHYPIFHQMEGVRVFEHSTLPRETPDDVATSIVVQELKTALEGMVQAVFGKVECRWVDAYFPFTHPSLELEIFFEGAWLEVLGCGMIHKDIMRNCGLGDHHGYAFGLGLERLAMVLFGIPDIRLFWSSDPRFLDQFASGNKKVKFQPYSKYPPCYKDISFWLPPPPAAFHENDFCCLVREVAGDLVENVTLIDSFSKGGRTSNCYRVMYRCMDRSLTNEEIDVLQGKLRELATSKLGIQLR